MGGGERLDGGDAGNDADGEFFALRQALQDAQGRVVEAGIAPDQEGAGAALGNIGDQRAEALGDGIVPGVDAGGVVRIGCVAHRHRVGDLPDRGVGDVAGDDLAAEVSQVRLPGALVRNEQPVGLVEGVDGLDRQMFGIAGADADQEQGAHDSGMPPTAGVDKNSTNQYYTDKLNDRWDMDPLSSTLAALADPTRRAILARLARGEASVNELAEPFDMTLAAVSKHIKVLENAGLVSRGRQAQYRPCRLEAEPMREVASYLEFYRRFWEQNLDQLDAYLTKLQTPETDTKN